MLLFEIGRYLPLQSREIVAVQQLGDFRVCELLTVLLAKLLAVFVGKTVREFQQALAEITLSGEVRGGVCPVELRI
jgi:hypothetical protein